MQQLIPITIDSIVNDHFATKCVCYTSTLFWACLCVWLVAAFSVSSRIS